MKPRIDGSQFGSISIDGVKFDHDVVLSLDGSVKKRKKKLSKEVFGTSHVLSLPEAQFIYEEGADCLIFGTGQSGMAKLSDEAINFFRRKGCQIEIAVTPKAIEIWNKWSGEAIGLFHVTC